MGERDGDVFQRAYLQTDCALLLASSTELERF